MSKTLQLISKYFSLLEEQAPEGDPAAGIEPATAAASAPPAEPQEQVGNIDENEKYIIKILTNAFIFNPTLFDKQKQKYIFNKIDQIKRMVNVPVAKIVDEVKNVIAIDKSLKVESKTLSLLDKYMLLIEQPADATEPQADTQPTQNSSTSQSQEKIIDGEGNNLNLAEIFPLYKELILKALKHAPTDDELMIIKPVVNEFADSDPEKIVETIQNILSQSLEDKEVEDNLSNA
jgi:hypothetical protein